MVRRIKSCSQWPPEVPQVVLEITPLLQTDWHGEFCLGEVLFTGEDLSDLLWHFKNKQTNCVLNLQYVLLVVY